MSWSEILLAVNNNLSKPLNELIGFSNPAKGETDTVMGYLKLLEDRGVVKSIQRGIIAAEATTSSNETHSVKIASVNPLKCLVIFDNGAIQETAGSIKGAYLVSLTTTQLTVRPSFRSQNSISDLTGWQIIEFY